MIVLTRLQRLQTKALDVKNARVVTGFTLRQIRA